MSDRSIEVLNRKLQGFHHIPMLSDDKKTIRAFMLTGLLLFTLFLISVFLDDQQRKFILEEGGLIESATALGYFVCIVVMIYRGRLTYIKNNHPLFLLIIFFMLRELDFHTRFTTTGILKIRFFTSAQVPLTEKAIGLVVIAILLYVVLMILHSHLRDFLMKLRKKDTLSIGVFITCALLAISQIFDGFYKKLMRLGVEVSTKLSQAATALEEIAELGIPLIIFITLTTYFRKTQSPKKYSSS